MYKLLANWSAQFLRRAYADQRIWYLANFTTKELNPRGEHIFCHPELGCFDVS